MRRENNEGFHHLVRIINQKKSLKNYKIFNIIIIFLLLFATPQIIIKYNNNKQQGGEETFK